MLPTIEARLHSWNLYLQETWAGMDHVLAYCQAGIAVLAVIFWIVLKRKKDIW